MSNISLPIPGAVGVGTSVGVGNQDNNKSYLFAAGGPTDITDIEVSDDGANWIKTGSRQTGGAWIANVTGKFQNTRLNRIGVDPLSAAVAFVNANDVIAAVQQGPAGPQTFGAYSINSGGNVNNTPGVLATVIASFGTQADGSYQVEINLSYRNTATYASGSRKVTGTVRRLLGVLTIEAQSNPALNLNDNAVFGANIATVLTVAGSAVQLSVTGIAATSIDWNANGSINFVA